MEIDMEWISVEDRLPVVGENVIWYHKELNTCEIERYYPAVANYGYTHWMPLPAPPEAE